MHRGRIQKKTKGENIIAQRTHETHEKEVGKRALHPWRTEEPEGISKEIQTKRTSKRKLIGY